MTKATLPVNIFFLLQRGKIHGYYRLNTEDISNGIFKVKLKILRTQQLSVNFLYNFIHICD